MGGNRQLVPVCASCTSFRLRETTFYGGNAQCHGEEPLITHSKPHVRLRQLLLALPVRQPHRMPICRDRVELIIPFGEGGGTDTWGRFGRRISVSSAGQPDRCRQNIPGGGSTSGANQFEARAKPDGLTAIGTSGSTQFPYLLRDKRVQFEMRDWRVVLASPTGGVVYVNSDLGLESAADLSALENVQLRYGSQGATSLDLVPLLAFELLGLDVDAVFGMKGRGAGRLAFERGEVNIDYQTSSAFINNVVPLVNIGSAVPLFSWGAMDDDGNIVRDPSFPDLPSFPEAYEMMKGEKPSGPAWEAYKAFSLPVSRLRKWFSCRKIRLKKLCRPIVMPQWPQPRMQALLQTVRHSW